MTAPQGRLTVKMTPQAQIRPNTTAVRCERLQTTTAGRVASVSDGYGRRKSNNDMVFVIFLILILLLLSEDDL